MDESMNFLVMEYFPEGSLLNAIQTRNFSDKDKLNLCAGITNGLWHLHASEVLHGDLALRNVLINTVTMRAVLSDFGQSCRHPCKSPREIICPRWSSPALIRTRLLTFDSDIWAIGVTFWELFSNGRKPYLHLKGNEVISRLMETNLHPKIDDSWPISDILTRIFTVDKNGDCMVKSATVIHDLIDSAKVLCDE
eukprot:UN26404